MTKVRNVSTFRLTIPFVKYFSSLPLSLSICIRFGNDYSSRKKNKWRSKLLFRHNFYDNHQKKAFSLDRLLGLSLTSTFTLYISGILYKALNFQHKTQNWNRSPVWLNFLQLRQPLIKNLSSSNVLSLLCLKPTVKHLQHFMQH